MADMIDETILEIICCPQDKQYLHYVPGAVFYNPRLRVAYPIRDGIPLLLAQDTISITEKEQHEKYIQGRMTGKCP